MHKNRINIEKRKEPRFGLTMLALITLRTSQASTKTHEAKIEDISLHGLKSSSKNTLHPGQDVEINYFHSESGERVRLLGCIKWQSAGHELNKMGIELYHRNTSSLTIDQASSYLMPAPIVPSSSNPNPFKQKTIWPVFHLEFFWGLLLRTFQKELEYNLVHLSSDYLLSSAYLEKILHDIPENALPAELAKKIGDVLNALQQTNNGFFRLTKIFQVMIEENISKNRSALENEQQKIDLNILLKERVDSLRNKLECLMAPEQNQFMLQFGRIRKFNGYSWKISFGLDFLLLHSYQFLLMKNATSIQLSLNDHQGVICLHLKNNGSALLSGGEEDVFLKLDRDIPENLRASDRKQLSWLLYTLIFFNEFNPAIKIKSVSGKNLVSLLLHKTNNES